MAKVMCVGCGPMTVEYFKLEGNFHLIELDSKDSAERFLESLTSGTVPDIIVLGKVLWRGLPRKRIKRDMINFAERLKHRAPTAMIILLNDTVSHRRSPRSITAACNSDPVIALSTIRRILSPTG